MGTAVVQGRVTTDNLEVVGRGQRTLTAGQTIHWVQCLRLPGHVTSILLNFISKNNPSFRLKEYFNPKYEYCHFIQTQLLNIHLNFVWKGPKWAKVLGA